MGDDCKLWYRTVSSWKLHPLLPVVHDGQKLKFFRSKNYNVTQVDESILLSAWPGSFGFKVTELSRGNSQSFFSRKWPPVPLWFKAHSFIFWARILMVLHSGLLCFLVAEWSCSWMLWLEGMRLLVMSFVFRVIEDHQHELLYKYLWIFLFLHVLPWNVFMRSDLDWCKSEIRTQENGLIKYKFVSFLAPYLSSSRIHLHFSQDFPCMNAQPMWSNVEFYILGI